MGEITVPIAHVNPPGQSKPGSLVAPQPFDRAFKLVVLKREHLIKGLLTDEPFPFEYASVQVADQPVRLVVHCAVDNACGPNSGFKPDRWSLLPAFFIDYIWN